MGMPPVGMPGGMPPKPPLKPQKEQEPAPLPNKPLEKTPTPGNGIPPSKSLGGKPEPPPPPEAAKPPTKPGDIIKPGETPVPPPVPPGKTPVENGVPYWHPYYEPAKGQFSGLNEGKVFGSWVPREEHLKNVEKALEKLNAGQLELKRPEIKDFPIPPKK